MQFFFSNHSFSWEICLAILLQSSAALPWHNGVLTQKRWKVKMQKCIKWGIEKDPSAPLLLQKTDMNLFIIRCIISCSKKNGEDLIKFQKILVAFMTPLPFAYTGTMSIFRLSNEKSLGYAHLVSKYLSWCLSQSYIPQAGASSGFQPYQVKNTTTKKFKSFIFMRNLSCNFATEQCRPVLRQWRLNPKEMKG